MRSVTPAAGPAPLSPPLPEDAVRARERQTVLIVDDNPGVSEACGCFLEHSGYRVVRAATGLQGLSRAAEHRPEAVLLDLSLPDMRGEDVADLLRASFPSLAIIAFSADVPAAERVRASCGAFRGLVLKPASGEVILRAIRQALGEPARPKPRRRSRVRRIGGVVGVADPLGVRMRAGPPAVRSRAWDRPTRRGDLGL